MYLCGLKNMSSKGLIFLIQRTQSIPVCIDVDNLFPLAVRHWATIFSYKYPRLTLNLSSGSSI